VKPACSACCVSGARWTFCVNTPAGGSPEQGVPRLAAAAATARLRRRHHRPNLRSKSSLGSPRTTPRPLPPGQGRRLRRNCAACAGHRPRDHIARCQFFSRVNPQRTGIFVRPQSFPGTLLQDESSIVCGELLILRSP
jgi:hypothetical protein